MRSIRTDSELAFLESRVLHHAAAFGRTLPEMRFFILNPMEFSSLLIKHVYPVSPPNMWEGKEMVQTRNRIDSGQESSLYYEVVQTGRPSYAYLNETNNAMTQASVMAHVVGHCEFSELNVMHDSDDDRTEKVIHLARKAEQARRSMGEMSWRAWWNACESVAPLIAPNSQYNLAGSIETDASNAQATMEHEEHEKPLLSSIPYSSTIQEILMPEQLKTERLVKEDERRRARAETLSRRGYKLRAPCQDILGFLRDYAPKSAAERSVLDYLYAVRCKSDFVGRTQIMNEGWAMYWEKKIMTELFKERACTGIIESCKVFSGVCAPRPWFQRNPYHLGFHMWTRIEEDWNKGRLSKQFSDETSSHNKAGWNQQPEKPAIDFMGHLVRTCTDHEFLRRYLSLEMLEEFHLNRVDKRMAQQIGLSADDIVREDRRYVWVKPDDVKDEMLKLFSHFHRPRLYLIDTDFMDGGLLIYHRDDGRALRSDWIKPTLKNINLIWKGPVCLLTKDNLYTWTAGNYNELRASAPDFETVCARMQDGEKPYKR